MSYKKFIKRNGRTYGPYIYHSRRVNGKVISEYHGTSKKISHKSFTWIFIFVFLVAMIALTAVYFKNFFSGRAVLEVNAGYEEGVPLGGILTLSLKEGELIPASSKVVFEDSLGKIYEYELNKIILDEPVEGEYYIEEKSISGSGSGYGNQGVKEIYPDVEFTIDIYSKKIPEELPVVQESEKVEEISNVNANVPAVENNESEKFQEPEVNEAVVQEILQEKVKVVETPEAIEKSEEKEIVKKEKGEEKQEEKIEKQEAPKSSGQPESTETISETESPEPEADSITGGLITGFFSRIFNFFLNFRPTGRAVAEIVKKINGTVSKDNPFYYELEKEQSAEITSSTHNVVLETKNNVAIVTTDYSEIETGFGEDYLGEEESFFEINLSELNAIFEKGELKIKIIYNSEEVLSLSTILEQGSIISEKEIKKNISDINATELTNATINEIEFANLAILSDEEKNALKAEFGNFSIETTKSELFNGRIVLEYKLNDYEIEHSYDANFSKETLAVQMEEDRIKWLKDIARKLMKNETIPEKIEEFEGNYSIGIFD